MGKGAYRIKMRSVSQPLCHYKSVAGSKGGFSGSSPSTRMPSAFSNLGLGCNQSQLEREKRKAREKSGSDENAD